jgi:3-hydroxymyristoyl/3-hydroxydecanoyl-(acyl carrier protein) dehydratase
MEDSPKKYTAKWSVTPELPYFEGHFPQNPLLPAIALLDLSIEFLKLILKKPIEFKTISSAKFLEPIRPQDILTIEFSSNQESQNWACLFKNQENVTVCKLSFDI